MIRGRRTPDVEDPCAFPTAEPGDYFKLGGEWLVRPPESALYPTTVCARITRHSVVEHADGTITVSPSILMGMAGDDSDFGKWHGFLEAGVWREVL